MEENDKKIDDVKKAKEIMGKTDPELLSAALEEIIIEADEAEKPDVEKVKKALRDVYDSIPEGKDKASIMSKAIAGLNTDVFEKEVGTIKEKLKGFSKETLLSAAGNYVNVKCIATRCIGYYDIAQPDWQPIPTTQKCIATRCIGYYDIAQPDWRTIPAKQCPAPVGVFMQDPDGDPANLVPFDREQFKTEVIQEMLQNPRLSRAMKKMLKEIKDEESK